MKSSIFRKGRKITEHACGMAMLILLAACSGSKGGDADSDSLGDESPMFAVDDSFHADNDIAMLVMSLADAISVDEELDPEAYSYTAVLTDGAGRMLYTDESGMPGEWEVRVVTPDSAVVVSRHPGKVPVEPIIDYLIYSTGMETKTDEDMNYYYTLGYSKIEFEDVLQQDKNDVKVVGLEIKFSKILVKNS